MTGRRFRTLAAIAGLVLVATGAGAWRWSATATEAATGAVDPVATSTTEIVAEPMTTEVPTTTPAPAGEDETGAVAAGGPEPSAEVLTQCTGGLRELATRDLTGQLVWEEEPDIELTDEDYEALEVPSPPFDDSVWSPDRRPATEGFGSTDPTDLTQESLQWLVESCWVAGVIDEATEQRIWEETWEELDAAGLVVTEDADEDTELDDDPDRDDPEDDDPDRDDPEDDDPDRDDPEDDDTDRDDPDDRDDPEDE